MAADLTTGADGVRGFHEAEFAATKFQKFTTTAEIPSAQYSSQGRDDAVGDVDMFGQGGGLGKVSKGVPTSPTTSTFSNQPGTTGQGADFPAQEARAARKMPYKAGETPSHPGDSKGRVKGSY